MTKRGSLGVFSRLAMIALGAACATTGVDGDGDLNLPTASVGPFRKLAADEVPGIAPFVFDDRTTLYREPAALTEGSDVILFAVARNGSGAAATDVIVRTRATDGRAFLGTSADTSHVAPVVLRPTEAWEGGALSGPFVVRAGADVLLYYAAAGGIGLARSSDGGLTFQKVPGPIFVRDPAVAWETTQVRAPGVYVLPDGRSRLLYTAGPCIGEAESTDGVRFTRLDADPSTPAIDFVLGPGAPAAPGSLLPNEKPPFDTASVADASPSTRITPAGRLHVRVLYTGRDPAGVSTIGFAARYGDAGRLDRNRSPVYSVGANEAAPAYAEVPGGAFLYVQQTRRVDERLSYSAIAAAFAPGTVKLPAPASYPDAP